MTLGPGDKIEMTVTPDPYVTVRYAGASGDFNPIHIDERFAQEVGLPGRILHGLWTMAQVARAVTEAAGGPTGAPGGGAPGGSAAGGSATSGGAQGGATTTETLAALSVQFRGLGEIGEEITVSGTVTGIEDGVASAKLEAHQAGRRIIRNGRAEIRVSQ